MSRSVSAVFRYVGLPCKVDMKFVRASALRYGSRGPEARGNAGLWSASFVGRFSRPARGTIRNRTARGSVRDGTEGLLLRCVRTVRRKG